MEIALLALWAKIYFSFAICFPCGILADVENFIHNFQCSRDLLPGIERRVFLPLQEFRFMESVICRMHATCSTDLLHWIFFRKSEGHGRGAVQTESCLISLWLLKTHGDTVDFTYRSRNVVQMEPAMGWDDLYDEERRDLLNELRVKEKRGL